MTKILSISLPDDLFNDYQKYKADFKIPLSRIFQKTLRREIDEIRAFKKRMKDDKESISERVKRLKQQKEAEDMSVRQRAVNDGFKWAKIANYGEMRKVVKIVTDYDKKPMNTNQSKSYWFSNLCKIILNYEFPDYLCSLNEVYAEFFAREVVDFWETIETKLSL